MSPSAVDMARFLAYLLNLQGAITKITLPKAHRQTETMIPFTGNTPLSKLRHKWLPLVLFVPLLTIVLAGCSRQKPLTLVPQPVALPENFSFQGTSESSEIWWRTLEDNGLQLLVNQALQNNFSLLAYRERIQQAAALAKEAGAGLFPSLTVNASASHTRADQDTNSTTDTLQLGLSLSYELDLWGRLNAKDTAAELDRLSAEADLEAATMSLVGQLAGIWYQLGAASEQTDLLQKQQQVNTTGLDLVKLRFGAGQVSIADMLQQQQLIEETNGELAKQKAVMRVLENQLAVLCGVAPTLFSLPIQPRLVELPSLPDTGVVADMLKNRPDIRSSYLALQSANSDLAAAIAATYPRLSFGGDLTTSASRVRDLFDNWLATLAASLVAPLWDSGLRQAEVDRNLAVTREKLNSYSESLLTAVSEVENALIREQEQRHFLSSLQLQLDLASQTVSTLKERYKQGTIDYQRILSALLSQQNLQRSIVTAREQLIGYRIDLYLALGGTIPDFTQTAAAGSTQ